MKSTFKIHYPEEKTYWIFWTDKETKFVYGSTDTTQTTDTNQPNWWTTVDEVVWASKLQNEFNTNPYPPEEEEEL